MFSVRLEGLFKLAFPKHKINTGSTLINQFKHAVPKSVRKMLKMQILACKLKEDKLNWSFIQQCARLNDIEDQKVKQDSDTSVEMVRETQKEVLISLGEKREDRNKQTQLRHENSKRVDSYSGENNQSYRGNTVFNNKKFDRPNASNGNIERGGNHNTHSRNFDRVVFCDLCKKFGHFDSACYSRIKGCFACGSLEHFARSCPGRYHAQSFSNLSASSAVNGTQNGNSIQSSQNNRSQFVSQQRGRGGFPRNNRGYQSYNRDSSNDRNSYNRSNDMNSRNRNFSDNYSRPYSRGHYQNVNRGNSAQGLYEQNVNQTGRDGGKTSWMSEQQNLN